VSGHECYLQAVRDAACEISALTLRLGQMEKLNEQEKRREKIYLLGERKGNPVGVHTQNAVGQGGKRRKKNCEKLAELKIHSASMLVPR